MTRDGIIAEAKTWLDTPWVHQSSLKGVGADCVGFVGGALINIGAFPHNAPGVEKFAGYSRTPDGRLQDALDTFLMRIAAADILVGDILLCRFREGLPQHLGVVSSLDPLRWIHSDNRKRGGVRETQVAFGPHRMSLVQAYRVPGL